MARTCMAPVYDVLRTPSARPISAGSSPDRTTTRAPLRNRASSHRTSYGEPLPTVPDANGFCHANGLGGGVADIHYGDKQLSKLDKCLEQINLKSP
jgi:hypothetical protein